MMARSIRTVDDALLTMPPSPLKASPAHPTTTTANATSGDGLPLWERIASALREEILAGRHAPGARLPNETTLAERFGVNRHTLRQAVQALVREGHLRVAHGSGTYVRDLVLDYALQRRTRLTQNLAEAGERAQRELLGTQRMVAGSAWAGPLKVSPRSSVLLLHTRATVRGRPVGISTQAYPCPRLEGMAEAFVQHGGITAALRSLGVADYTRARSTIGCRLPDAAEADALARPASQPVLVVSYVNVDLNGQPVEAGTTLFAADAVQLTVDHESMAAAAPDLDTASGVADVTG